MPQAETKRYDPISRLFVMVVASVVVAIVIAVGAVVSTRPAPGPPAEAPLASLSLRFVDLPDGAMSVIDHATGRQIAHFADGENGFVTTLIRVVRRDLPRADVSNSMPFRIEAWQGNRVTLTDSINERRIDVRAFGPTNEAVFLRWLQERDGRG